MVHQFPAVNILEEEATVVSFCTPLSVVNIHT